MKKDKHPTENIGRNPKISERKKAKLKKLPVIGFGKINAANFSPKSVVKKLKNANKNALLAGSLGLVLVVVGAFSLMFSANSGNEFANSDEIVESTIGETPLISAGINLIEGTLQTKDETGKWVDVENKDELQIVQSTALRTSGASSRASVVLQDGSIIRIDGNSEIEFETLSIERVEIKHVSGYAYSRVSDSPDRVYIVKTTEAQYEAQGTAFKTIASGDEQAVEVYHSSILETYTNKAAKEGEKLTVKSRVKPTDDRTVQKLDIEVVKNDPFIEWNRNLDIQNDLYKNQLGFLQDIVSPEVSISSPLDGATILLEPNAKQGSVEISGNTEKGITLTIQAKTASGSQPVTVSVGDDGAFKSPVIASPLGSSVFEIVAKDRTGNKTTKTLRLTFQAKSGAVTGGSIVLSTKLESGKVEASWAFSGSATAPDGVKLVYGKSESPSLNDGSSTSKYITSGSSTTIKVNEFDSGETYYFRACIYDADDGECSTYSKQTSLNIP